MPYVYDLIIIGGGAGGLTAAIYAGRAELKTLLIEKGSFGGQITDSLDVENYPANPHISGQALMDRFKKQASAASDVSFLTTTVTSIEPTRKHTQIVHTKRKGDFLANAIIVAVGAKPRRIGIPGELEFSGNGVSYCATCDAQFYKEKSVFVLGAGNQAIENAILLTKYASKVVVAVMHPKGMLDCNEVDRREAMQNPKIQFIWDSTLISINGKETVDSVTVENVLTGEQSIYKTDGVFSFVGMVPQTDFLPNSMFKDKHGYIKVNEHRETSIPGIFAIGDCIDTPLRQVVTAASDGAIAEVAVESYLKEINWLNQILNKDGKNEAIVFYSPYESKSVNKLKAIEDILGAKYRIDLDDITKQFLLYDQLSIDSSFAIALYQKGKLKKLIDMSTDTSMEILSTQVNAEM